MAIRPRTLHDYIGQNNIKEQLRIAMSAAKARGEPLPHVLLYGPPGLGKTSLAEVIANEMGAETFRTANAGAITDIHPTVFNILADIKQGDVLFIDEIHRLPRPVEESLYPVMEDLWFSCTSAYSGEVLEGAVLPFTLIGATTRAGDLSRPLRDRFGLQFRLSPYSVQDLSLIVVTVIVKMDLDVGPEACIEIAQRSRGVPREAVRYSERCRDYVQSLGRNKITLPDVIAVFDLLGVDEIGLTREDRRYLECLASSPRPKGLKALAAALDESEVTIEQVIEPYLTQLGFIERTGTGRAITQEGRDYMERGVIDHNILPLARDTA